MLLRETQSWIRMPRVSRGGRRFCLPDRRYVANPMPAPAGRDARHFSNRPSPARYSYSRFNATRARCK
jgi:hypothetical protein